VIGGRDHPERQSSLRKLRPALTRAKAAPDRLHAFAGLVRQREQHSLLVQVGQLKWTLGMGPVGSLETGLFPSW
jgi:hypothetical protein